MRFELPGSNLEGGRTAGDQIECGKDGEAHAAIAHGPKKLEEVATAAQSTHYADMRSLAAASWRSVTPSARSSRTRCSKGESDGYTQSGLLKGLQIECARLSANLQQKTEECSGLQGASEGGQGHDTKREDQPS